MTLLRAQNSEEALLGACIENPDRILLLALETTEADFTDRIRRRLREVILSIHQQGVSVTYGVLEERYMYLFEDSPADLREVDRIFNQGAVDANWGWHLRQVKSARVRRDVAMASEVLTHTALENPEDEEFLLEASRIATLANQLEVGDKGALMGRDVTPELKTDYFLGKNAMVDLRMGPKARPFAGIRKGEVFTFLARTWAGKSIWASQAVINAGVPSLVISLEMPRLQWWERTLMQLWNQPRQEAMSKLATGRASAEELAILGAAEKRIVLADRCSGTLPALDIAVQQAQSLLKVVPQLVVIDYLQLLRINPRASFYERMSEAAVGIKAFAKRHEISVILLSQIGRQQGGDGSSEVGMESARDSGQIEEAADFLFGLWRPAHQKGLPPEEVRRLEPEMTGRLIKNRRGRAYPWSFQLTPGTLRITPL